MLNTVLGTLSSGVAASTSSYESIASATGTGSSSTITFNSIPSGYASLQIRCIASTPDAVTDSVGRMIFNSDTGSNYASHLLYGNGSSVSATGLATRANLFGAVYVPGTTYNSNIRGAMIIDILDYTSTTKYKTVRFFGGMDTNGGVSYTALNSGLWMSTNAVTSISFDFVQNASTTSTFALYGIKG